MVPRTAQPILSVKQKQPSLSKQEVGTSQRQLLWEAEGREDQSLGESQSFPRKWKGGTEPEGKEAKPPISDFLSFQYGDH